MRHAQLHDGTGSNPKTHVNLKGRGMPDEGDLVDLIPEWITDEADHRRIPVDHPRALYGFATVA